MVRSIHCFFFHSNLFLLVFLSVFPTLWHCWQKWKRYWLNLYPGSRNGVARIELTEAVSERSPVMVRRQPDRKVVRLADCISVVKLPPNAEAHPGGNMAAFCVLTDEKKLVFAVEKEGCGEWVNKIFSCDSAAVRSLGAVRPVGRVLAATE
uniref:PH domain-containing protein n=1 Tax=Electrophorus electricus TaxID=8005 RepID=A0A4W4E0T6_ELEEL